MFVRVFKSDRSGGISPRCCVAENDDDNDDGCLVERTVVASLGGERG